LTYKNGGDKVNENLYTLICPNCGNTYSHIKRAMVCPNCGNIAQLPVFTDDECDEILSNDGDGPLPKANVKIAEKMKDRAPEDGGPVM